MKMNGFIVILLAGLVVCGCLIHRHRHRAAGVGAAPVRPPLADDLRSVDAWQPSITLGSPGPLDWREKLRREEEKQRPQEGRN